MAFYNQRLAALAEKKHRLGLWGDKNTGMRNLLSDSFTPDNRAGRLIWQGIKAWLSAEWRLAFYWAPAPAVTKGMETPPTAAKDMLGKIPEPIAG
jgi:hypothetical protein